jgi:hypothetical protein
MAHFAFLFSRSINNTDREASQIQRNQTSLLMPTVMPILIEERENYMNSIERKKGAKAELCPRSDQKYRKKSKNI